MCPAYDRRRTTKKLLSEAVMFCLRVFLYLVPVFEDESKYLDDRR